MKEIPDAKLYIVGSGDEELTQKLSDSVARLGLENNIVFTGFTLDVESYYRRASVCVLTSEREGFSLIIGEALSYSLPVVMYDLPWLTFVQSKKGIRVVEQKRFDLLASAVVRLLKNPEEAAQLGAEGRSFIDDLAKIDIAREWADFFDDIPAKKIAAAPQSNEGILFDYITKWQNLAKTNLLAKNKALTENFSNIEKLLSARIDIKNDGDPSNDVEIVEISDAEASATAPQWLKNKGAGGGGRVVTSLCGEMSARLKAKGNGTLMIALRGADIRDGEGKRIPVWINYSKLSIDGNVVFNEVKAVWHDRSYKLSKDVADGQIIDISVSWAPDSVRMGSGEDIRYAELERKRKNDIEKRDAEIAKRKNDIEKRDAEIAKRKAELTRIKNSRSFKLANKIAFPARWLRKLVTGKAGRS